MNDDNNQNELLKIRHSAEHVLMHAMLNLGYKFHMAMGPAIDDGFYFDFELLEGMVSEEDFAKIEKEMKKIIEGDYPITSAKISIAEARKLFEGNPYKQEWLDGIEKEGEEATVYWTGKPGEKESFVDLCAGPHVDSTGKIKAFKLLSIAGAYWHGDEKNKMLTRIYGTAFPSQEELDNYLKMREEAEKRNHRKIGQEMELFAIFPEIGQGLPVWLPNGFIVRRVLEDYMLDTERKHGYKHTITPVLNKAELFKTSGHLDFYSDSMYPQIEVDDEKFLLKPMSCPGAMLIY